MFCFQKAEAQDIKFSAKYAQGFFTFSTSENNSYLQNAEDFDFSAGMPGLKFTYGIDDLKLSLRASILSQQMEWDGVNVFPFSKTGV